MRHDREKTYTMAKIALCVSLMSVVSWFILPVPMTPVVLSLQSVAVGLTALILSPGQSAWAMALYIAMGASGLPVFSGGTAGLGKLFGPTGGFYFGFLLSAVTVSFFKGKSFSFIRYSAVLIVVGISLQHLCGMVLMCIHNGGDFKATFMSVSVPFIAGDIAKAVVTAYLGVAVNKRISKL